MKASGRVWLALLAAGLLGMLTSCDRAEANKPKQAPNPEIAVTVGKVEMIPIDRTIPVIGTLQPLDDALLGAEVEGQLEKTMAEFGDRLTNGQLIAQIDIDTYEAQVRQSAANLARARASALNAEQELRRTQDLQKQKVASESVLDKAVTELEVAKAEVKSAEASEAIARLKREKANVRAPFDCVVSERMSSAGDYMKVGTPLFRLVNDAELKFVVQTPERYSADVRKDQMVTFTVDAWPGQSFEGKVYLISPSVNQSTRSFNVAARVPNADRKLKASTFARGELLIERNVPTPVISQDAVVNFAGVTKVFVIDNGTARSRNIKVGRIKEGRQEVLDGLKVGEAVVLTGQTRLFDGAKARIKEK